MKVFISYARADGRKLAGRLAADLERHHNDTWFDQSDIQGGMDWAREIEKAIDRCDVLIALMSTASFASFYCRNEQARALRNEKPILPVLVQAGADRPLYLESAHYLDFTDDSHYDARLPELLKAIVGGDGVRLTDLDDSARRSLALEDTGTLTGPRPLGPGSKWSDVQKCAISQADRFLQELHGGDARRADYIADCYVSRQSAERELALFLTGHRPGLIVTGNAAAGKSNLLCHWTLGLLESGHAAFFYACGGTLPAHIDEEIARDLGLDDTERLDAALGQLDRLAEESGKKVVLVFDGLNEFRGADSSPKNLLQQLDRLVGRLDGNNVRLVLSCSSSTWARLHRPRQPKLFWSRYHRTKDDDQVLTLDRFDASEAVQAYSGYREFFDLPTSWAELPPALQTRLREPLIMRLLAEAYSGRREPITADVLTFTVIRSYLEQQVTEDDVPLLDVLATMMLQGQRSALATNELWKHPTLMVEADRTELDMIYQRVLDTGLLTESKGDLFTSSTVRFTHTRVGAFFLARHLSLTDSPVEETLQQLVRQAQGFPLSWEVALMLLRTPGVENSTYDLLAASRDSELRELVAEGLQEFHADEPERAREILTGMFAAESEEARHTALKAAYNIGPGARELFLRAAITGSTALRQTLKDVLYLIWRTGSHAAREDTTGVLYLLWRYDPGFTLDVLSELLTHIGWRDLFRGGPLLKFFIDLSVTIYINHCERADVIQHTDDLYYRLASESLPLARILLRAHGRLFSAVTGAITTAFARPILNWMGVDDAFFALPDEERNRLGRIARGLDPQAHLEELQEDLEALLRSDIVVFRGSAALVLAVHAYSDYPATEGMLRRLVDGTDPQGRLWLLLGFSVLLPDTPPYWKDFLEELTRRVVSELDRNGLPPANDKYAELVLVPLGLAYGKQGATMPLFEFLISDALKGGHIDDAARYIERLGPVGFYYPQGVFETLRSTIGNIDDPGLDDALVSCLARMRVLYLDAVDVFMSDLGIKEALRRSVAAESDFRLVQPYVQTIGFYNNSLHFSVHYPKMRRELSAGALRLLATTSSISAFLGEYTLTAVRMLKDADFRLVEWTKGNGS